MTQRRSDPRIQLSSSERPGGSSGWLQTVIYELWQVLTPCLLYRFRRCLGIAQTPWFTHLQIESWITKSYCVPLTFGIAERNRDAQMEVTSVNLLSHLSVLFRNWCPIGTDHLILDLLYIQKYPREAPNMHLRDFHTMLLLKLSVAEILTSLAKTLQVPLPSWVNYHRHDDDFKTACVLCTICAESQVFRP